MVTTIQKFAIFCLCLGVLGLDKIPTVADSFLTSLFAREKRDNAFTTLNDYLVDNTELGDLQENVHVARYLVDIDKFESIINKHPKQILSDEFKELASSLARLSDGRRHPMNKSFQLCSARNLSRLRKMTEVMNRNIAIETSKSFRRPRLAKLIVQTAKEAGKVCFARHEHKWFALRQRDCLPVGFERANFNKLHTGFMIFANLCQKYQNKKNLEEDDGFLRTAERALRHTAKLRPDIVVGALIYTSEGKRPAAAMIASLVQKVLLEPCREMYAVRELADTIKPIADLLITLVIVDPEDYFDTYIDPLSGEVKEWTRRFVLCEWLLAANLTKLSNALSRIGRWR